MDSDAPQRTPQDAMPSRETRNAETRSAGRGLVLILAAKVIFILSGWAIQLALPRIFASQATFGLYSVAIGVTSMLNNVLVVSTIQTLSKFVSEDDANASATLRQGLRIQAGLGLVLSCALLSAAPWIAENLLLDAQLLPLIRVAAAVVMAYALYASLAGFLNGKRLFRKQAALDMTFSVLRMSGILGGALLGFGALGAIVGWATAAAAILLIALMAVGVGKPGSLLPYRRWLVFLAPIWIYQIFLNGTLQIDLQILKRTLAEITLAQGGAESVAADFASTQAGLYRAAQVFAFVPYQLMIAVTLVVFPFVSKATKLGDHDATQRYVRNALRFSFLVLLAIAAPTAGAATGVIGLVFPASYTAAAGALEILAFGMVAFALFVIAATVLTGSGRPATAATVAGIAMVSVVVATRSLILSTSESGDVLASTATGTTLGMFIALMVVGVVVFRQFGAFIPPLSVARGALASIVAWWVAHALPHTGALEAILALAAGLGAFLLVLVGSRELGRREFEAVRTVLARRGQKAS